MQTVLKRIRVMGGLQPTIRIRVRVWLRFRLLDVACGKPARRRYCMHAPSAASVHAYSYIQQSGRGIKNYECQKYEK